VTLQGEGEVNNESFKKLSFRRKTESETFEENIMNKIVQESCDGMKKENILQPNDSSNRKEDEALTTALRESIDSGAKREIIDHLASLKSGGEIIPNNHAENFEIDDGVLATLLDMGFEVGRACIILKKCNNNSEQSLVMLLSDESPNEV